MGKVRLLSPWVSLWAGRSLFRLLDAGLLSNYNITIVMLEICFKTCKNVPPKI